MALIVAGASHRTAPVAIRERVAFSGAESAAAIAELKRSSSIVEGVLLSTCNRTELYLLADGDPLPAVLSTLSDRLGEDAAPYCYSRRDRDTVVHLFAVAAGLDSMVFGEAQISGQVKAAWENCRAVSGPVLGRLFQSASACAARVRAETAVGRGAGSVSSAAVQLAKKIFGSLAGRRAMILGAGDVAELALQCLSSEGVHVAIVANRTFARAQDLAARHGARALHYDDCWAELHEVDLLLCSTAAPRPIMHREHVAQTLRRRGGRPLCILDIAVPRDVSPDVGELENVFLYDLDDLQAAASATLNQRREDLEAAEAIVAAETERYWQWLAGLEAVPVLTRVREEMERLRLAELATAAKRYGPLTDEERETLDRFSRSLMNKFLHEPTVRLRGAAGNGRGLGMVDAARYLFGVEEASRQPPAEEPVSDS